MLYTVRYGDDLYSLARERGTTVELIICYNHLTGPFQVGQLIYLPPPPPTTPAPPLMPDLVVYQLSGPFQVQPGQLINQHMNLMITNQGEAGAGATVVDIVISRDTAIDAGDQWIGDGYVPAVAPNQIVTADLTLVQIPEDWPTSEVYIGVILDPSNDQTESDENNNTDHFSVYVSSPPRLPDLVVYKFSGLFQVQPGQIINEGIDLTATNIGEGEAGASKADIYISRDTEIGDGDIRIGEGDVPAVTPNQIVTADLHSVQIPESWPEGDAYLIAILDPLNQRPEFDEDNNTGHFPINVSAPPTPIAPSNLVYDRLGCAPVGLYWQDNAVIEEGYLVLRDGVEIAKLAPNTTSYVDRTATTREYKYGVAAFNTAGLSDVVSVVVPENICLGTLENLVD